MDNIRFSMETIAGFAVSGVIMIILPVVIFFVLRKRLNLKFKPVIVGAITFFLFAVVLKVPFAYPFLVADSELSRTINGNAWLTFLVAGVLAGVLEESGRFIAYKTILKSNTEKNTSIAYGIGHGGFECIYIGISTLSFIAMGMIVNSGDIGQLTAGMEGATLNAAIEQITQYASRSFGFSMLGIVERSSAIMLQIAWSIPVFAAARNKKQIWLFPVAIMIHAVLDFSLVFMQLGYINAVLAEVLFFVISAAMLFCAVRFVYGKMEDIQ